MTRGYTRRTHSPYVTGEGDSEMWISKRRVLYLFVFLLTVIFYSWIMPYVISGDTEYYRRFYTQIGDYNTWSARMSFSLTQIGSGEPVYMFLCYLCSKYISYEWFITLANAVLAVLISIVCTRGGVTRKGVFFLMLLLSSYYLIVLGTSSDRLKFAMIFLLTGYLWSSNCGSIVCFVVSCLTQVQVILLVFPIILFKYFSAKISFKYFKRVFLFSVLFVLIAIALWKLLSVYVLTKMDVYVSEGLNVSAFSKMLLFFLLTIAISHDRNLVILSFLPLLFAALILSVDRVVILGYFFYLAYQISVRRKFTIPAWIITSYFVVQSVSFVGNILKYGNGFLTSF